MKNIIGRWGVVAFVLVSLVLLAAGDRPGIPMPVPRVKINIPGFGKLTVAGPFTHKNLAFFIFYDPGSPLAEPDYITLEEGTAAGLVKISESRNAQVQRLLISNLSKKPLFIQIGEIVKGGKQDRTMQSSLVIPPKTNNVPVQSFCVEQSRWSGGKKFSAKGIIIPGNAMKAAVQSGSQGRVWSNVSRYKARARENAAVVSGKPIRESRSSSVNEELDDKHFRKLIGGYESALLPMLRRFKQPRGLAIIVDGKISTVDVYHASSLFKKLYPKLLKSAAAEAAAGKIKHRPKRITVKDLANFLKNAWDGKKRKEKLGFDNVFIRIQAAGALTSQLLYKDNLIHAQVLKVDPKMLRQNTNSLRRNNDVLPEQLPNRRR